MLFTILSLSAELTALPTGLSLDLLSKGSMSCGSASHLILAALSLAQSQTSPVSLAVDGLLKCRMSVYPTLLLLGASLCALSSTLSGLLTPQPCS